MKSIPAITGILFCLILSACTRLALTPDIPAVTSLPPTSTSTPDSASANMDEQPPVGPCAHLLWPLSNGAAWIYQLSSPSGARQLTLTSDITPEGASLTLDGQTGTLSCFDGALSGLPPLLIGHPDLGNGVTGANPLGSYLPAPAQLLPLGTPVTWDQELDAGGTITLPFVDSGTPLTITGGKVVLFNTSGEVETVSVPAGTYMALPIHQDALYQLQVSLPDGTILDALISAAALLHFVEGVGLVKVSYEGGTISTPSTAWELEPGLSLELLNLTLP